MRKKITTKKKSKSDIIKELKKEHDKVQRELDNDIGNQRAYVNLPLTLLERTFFEVIAKDVFNKDQTKLLRSIIHKMMVRHPECVEKARQLINERNG